MSRLSEILTKFGFGDKGEIPAREVQKALLQNLYFAGYFKPQAIWQAINLMQFDAAGKETKLWKLGVVNSFDAMLTVLEKSGANQDNSQNFNADFLLDNFMEQKIFFDEQDIGNLVTYLAQNAFARAVGQERNELARLPWSDIHRDAYLANAKKIGMFDEMQPRLGEYDETWIQGAARLRTKARMEFAKKIQDQGKILGQIRLLTGERELWAEIDKLPSESLEDSKNFMLGLAQKLGIKTEGFETREVAGSNRTYLKYAQGEKRKLTETLMAKESYFEVFGHEILEEDIIDSKLLEDGLRPTTATNAADVTREKLSHKIEQNYFDSRTPNIMIVSNQPYVDRQVITNCRAVAKEMKKLGIEQEINFEGVGEACEVAVTAIHSEMAALVLEGFMQSIEKTTEARKCEPKQLSFQDRCKKIELAPPMPQLNSYLEKFSAKAKISSIQSNVRS